MSSTIIERAYDHVVTNWFPVQSEVLERIQSRLAAGEYDAHRKELTKDLKEDFSLFMFCLKELTGLLETNKLHGVPQPQNSTPIDMIESSDIEVLKSILAAPPSVISTHSMADINELQTLRFRDSMLSASVAELLAEKTDIDPDLGFSCGLLRQLGLTLISWNYPRVYARALENLPANCTLDTALQKVLGFSPSLLGITCARRWNLLPEIMVALGDKERPVAPAFGAPVFGDYKTSAAEADIANKLAKICEVGEALARANDPEHYPTALADWKIAEEAIIEHLGPDGISAVFDRAKHNCKSYAKQSPELVAFTQTTPVAEKIANSQYAKVLTERNVHLKTCPKELRDKIVELYHHLSADKISQENLRVFVHEVIPYAGFNAGCIFMLDPAKRVLAPVMKLGALPKERLRSVGLSSVLAQFDIVASAYSCKSPLREQSAPQGGKRKTGVAGVVGNNTPVGVLYLETETEERSGEEVDPMPSFRALRQALNDCLNLD